MQNQSGKPAPRALVLIDLDGTLIDGQYNLTVPEEALRASISDATAVGALVGVSSDSSLQRIGRFALAHGLEGPIVAERGAVWAPSAGRIEEAAASRPEAAAFSAARDWLVATLGGDSQTLLEVGDVNRRSRELIGAPVPEGKNRAVLINGERRGSLAFYALVARNGAWAIDPSTLGEVGSLARAAVSEIDPAFAAELDVDFNEGYGVAIFHAPGTGKSLAIPALRDRFGDLPLFVVGDSDADWHHVPNVSHCAVANGSEGFRAGADFVASAPIAEGAIQCLGWIGDRLRDVSLTPPLADRSVSASPTRANTN
jgi:hypothetical protein